MRFLLWLGAISLRKRKKPCEIKVTRIKHDLGKGRVTFYSVESENNFLFLQ